MHMPEAAQTADVDTDRDSILAEMAATSKPAEAKAEPAKAAEPVAAAEPDDTADEAVAAVAAVEPAKAPTADPEFEKRRTALQRQERLQKQQLAAERQKLDAERAEMEKERAELADLKQLRARAKYDPLAYLRAGGVDEDALEDVAKAAYAASKAGAAKPENREAAARALKDREQYDKLSATEKRLADLEAKIEAQRTSAAAERQAEKYMAGVLKTAKASADAPLLAKLLENNPDKADAELRRIAYQLAQDTDEVPDADDVIATYEKQRRADLAENGIDVAEFLKSKPKQPSKPAVEKPTARTLSNDLSTSTQVRRSDAMSEAEERDEILREIAKINAASNAA